MTTAIDIGAWGMSNDIRLLDIISHNLANANTPGFKREIAVAGAFDRLLVNAIDTRVDHSPGALRYTGNPLDLAIEGNAFFELRGAEGIRYSRQGVFSIDAGGRLVNSHGLVVSGEGGDILLHGGDITVAGDGVVSENGEIAGALKLVSFTDPSALIKAGNGTLRAPARVAPRPAEQGADGDYTGIRQGYQEASNVDAMAEMVNLMLALRHFESTAQIIKSYDAMMGTAIATIAEF